jgi:hypothetical protein
MKNAVAFKYFLFLLLIINTYCYSQMSLGDSKIFIENLRKSIVTKEGKTPEQLLKVKVDDKTNLEVKVNYNNADNYGTSLIGEVLNSKRGTFDIRYSENTLEGLIVLYETKKAFKYYSDATGAAFIAPADINSVVCVDYPVVSEVKKVTKKAKKKKKKRIVKK